MTSHRPVALLAAALLTLSACGDSSTSRGTTSTQGSSPPTSTTTSPVVPASPSSSTPSSSPPATRASSSSSASSPSCSDQTAQEALRTALTKVPPSAPGADWAWDPTVANPTTYDPCAELSWIEVGIPRPTGSSPKQVLLFHRGDLVATATKKPESFIPSVDRVSDAAIEVTYGFTQTGESNASASGRATSTFAWDEKRRVVVRSGTLPPGSSSPAESATEATKGGSCAGGFQPPAGVDASVCGDPGPSARALVPGEDNTALAITPSRNIWCTFGLEWLDCSAIDTAVRIDLGLTGKALVPLRDDGPSGDEPTTMQYGETVTFGPFACHSQEIGISCWNVTTRHGLFISREQHHMW